MYTTKISNEIWGQDWFLQLVVTQFLLGCDFPMEKMVAILGGVSRFIRAFISSKFTQSIRTLPGYNTSKNAGHFHVFVLYRDKPAFWELKTTRFHLRGFDFRLSLVVERDESLVMLSHCASAISEESNIIHLTLRDKSKALPILLPIDPDNYEFLEITKNKRISICHREIIFFRGVKECKVAILFESAAFADRPDSPYQLARRNAMKRNVQAIGQCIVTSENQVLKTRTEQFSTILRQLEEESE